MSRRRPPRAALVLLLVAAWLLAACGREQPPPEPLPELTSGTAPATQQPAVLPDYGPRSIGDGAEWPRACDLVTVEEVRAILPETTAIERDGRPWEIAHQSVAPSPSGPAVEPATDRYARSRVIVVPEQACELSIELPAGDGTFEPREPPERARASVDITVEMVGSPDTVRTEWSSRQRAWPRQHPVPGAFGADECVDNTRGTRARGVASASFVCRKGRMMIEVTGSFLHFGDVRIAGRADDPDPAVIDEWFRSRVMPQFLGVVVRRMA